MTTANIILAVCLILMMGLAALLIIRYMRKEREVEQLAQDLKAQEQGLTKRQNSLDLWEKQLKATAKQTAHQKHIYANKSIDDPDNEAPAIQDHNTYKKLVSQFGYSVGKFFRNEITRTHQDGKTIYSLDLNIYPFGD